MKFKNWTEQADIPILWVCGQSGAGKSHLAAKIVKHFGPSPLIGDKDAQNATVAAYFCEYNDADGNEDMEGADKNLPDGNEADQDQGDSNNDYDDDRESVGRMLRTLSSQILVNKKYEKELTDHLDAVKIKIQVNSKATDVWKCLFQNDYFENLQGRFVTIVIDGIDNLAKKDREVFYGLLKEIIDAPTNAGGSKVKFAVLSQHKSFEEITKILPDSRIPCITITAENNREDIEKCLTWSIENSPKLCRALRDESRRTETIRRLAETTKGVFESIHP